MKYFLDTEFIEDGRTIDLISIALVCEDGRSLYLQNTECLFPRASEWIYRNVFPHLTHFAMNKVWRECSSRSHVYDSGLGKTEITKCCEDHPDLEEPCPWATRLEIKEAVLAFCDPGVHGKPEFWGYFADYDWVVFCQLFGPMINLPKGYPMYCRDLKQWADALSDVRIPKPDKEIHNALADALWIKEGYAFLLKHSLQD